MDCCGIDLISEAAPTPASLLYEAFIVGSAITAGDLFTINSTNQAIPAVSTVAVDNFQVMGISLDSAGIGATIRGVVLRGRTVAARFSVAPAAVSNGSYVFLSSTPGVATLNAPLPGVNIQLVVGVLRGANGATLSPAIQFQTFLV